MEQPTPYPTGTVTFLFTDIEGSTERWERDRTAMAEAVDRHLVLLQHAVEAHRGVLFKVVGDAGQAAFPTAPDAVAAALEAQRALLTADWGSVGELRVRMALHVGEAEPRDGDYLAPALNRLARLVAAGHGSKVLLTLAAADLARDRLPAGAGLRDLGEHSLRDLYRPERVFQLLHPDLPVDFPPLQTLATRPNNLPLQPTPFVGREDQVVRIVELLSRDDVRLLTITGPGGVGKTRLALQAAADLLDRFADGVWFVDLSALSDPSHVIPAIAKVLGVRDEATGLVDRLGSALAQQRVLLVLDNFERLVAAASVVADLLVRAPGLKVLVTSRIPMHAYGEREYPLLPFPMPDLAHLPSLERLSQYEAVRLFIERAQAVKPDFAVTTANAPAVAEICHRLDGLPLAIELAAAYVKVLPPQALLKRLERRLPLLTGGARTLPARQQTMRDAIAWSHDLLTPDEQLIFRRLAVFPGGCTLEAAETVAGQDGALDVFAGIASLVDKSLLRQEEGSEGDPRFRMLETVREYGLERLEASSEGEVVRPRLADWYLDLAEVAASDFDAGRDVSRWLARLDDELPNLRAALAWLLEIGDRQGLLRLLGNTDEFWAARPFFAEARRWLEAGFANASDVIPSVQARALFVFTYVTAALGDPEAAVARAEEGLALARSLDDPFAIGRAYFSLGMAWEIAGDVTRAATFYADSVPFLRQAGEVTWSAVSLSNAGDMRLLENDVAGAVAMVDEALALQRQVGYTTGIALSLGHRAHAARIQGDLGLAARLFKESLETAQGIDAPRILLGAVVGLAGVALACGQPERAGRLLGGTEAARMAMGIGRIAHTLHAERIISATREALGEPAFAQAWDVGRALPLQKVIADAVMLADELQQTTRELTA